MIYIALYFEFFKIGLFAVGGGLATIPFLYQLSYKTAWFAPQDIINMIAISEITPGPLGINMATFAGWHTGGVLGALAATFGIVTPALLAIILIAGMLKKYIDNKYVQSALRGMGAAVCALISVSVLKILEAALINPPAYKATGNFTDLLSLPAVIFFTVLLLAIRRFKIHPFAFICISAAAGLFIKF